MTHRPDWPLEVNPEALREAAHKRSRLAGGLQGPGFSLPHRDWSAALL